MTRVKGGNVAKNRRRKVLKEAKGYFGSKHRLFKTAQEQTFHSGAYAFRDRRANKRNFRKLWIIRINAACHENDISYSRFISGLTKAGVEINRKMLSELAIDNPASFKELVKLAKDANDGKIVKKEVKEEAPKKEVKEEKVEKKEVKEEKTTKKETPKKEASKDLSSLTVAELKEMAKKKKIEDYTSMKKAELVKALSK